MNSSVVTRFAPSPTGFLHVGGARTALFNWLFAKANDGRMLLRIEDTDRARSTDAAIAAILDGLAWLELDWDGEPVHQFSRADRHREIAEALLASGNAYRCYATPQELEKMRERARAEGRAPGYDGRWRDRDPSEAPSAIDPAIRLKTPREGVTVIDDRVQGRVAFQNNDLDDLILLRSDGTPTYMLSVVVDDHDMGVTHIIRGDDHLTNAARQAHIYNALGWDIPVFAHVALIHGPDGAKLSKRHGALGVEAYRQMGYLPQAMRNYLVRLGWSHGNDEIMSTEEMIEWFGLEAIGRSPARFDCVKLNNLNGQYLRNTDDGVLVEHVRSLLPHLPDGPALLARIDDPGWRRLRLAMSGLKERANTLVELIDNARFLFAARPIVPDEAASKLLDANGRGVIEALIPQLQSLERWEAQSIETEIRRVAEAKGLKLGKVAQPLRAALTGRAVSPGIFDVLAVLGKDEALRRLRDTAESRP